jgi:hypothetical protein
VLRTSQFNLTSLTVKLRRNKKSNGLRRVERRLRQAKRIFCHS